MSLSRNISKLIKNVYIYIYRGGLYIIYLQKHWTFVIENFKNSNKKEEERELQFRCNLANAKCKYTKIYTFSSMQLELLKNAFNSLQTYTHALERELAFRNCVEFIINEK